MLLIIVLTAFLILGLLVYLGKRKIAYETKELREYMQERKTIRMKWHELEFERIMVAVDLLGIKKISELQTKEKEELRHKYSQDVETQKLWQ
jgi:H+/gluconate symporter-like permease